jgi:peptidyl-dipeptidase Dcp
MAEGPAVRTPGLPRLSLAGSARSYSPHSDPTPCATCAVSADAMNARAPLPLLLPLAAMLTPAVATVAAVPVADGGNPLLVESTLPFQCPHFDRLRDRHFLPALEAGMREQQAEIEAIARLPAVADFDNTIVALERSGRLLHRALTTFSNLNATDASAAMQQVQQQIAPRLAEHRDAMLLDGCLWARVQAVHAAREQLALDAESAQLLARTHAHFVRAGAALADAPKARLRALNAELSTLTTRFQQNVRAATRDAALVVDSVAELDGLSASQLSAAAEAAKARGLDGKWLLTLQSTSLQPALAQLSSRALRERLYRASIGRATTGVHDNRPVIAAIVALRAERAQLLGHPHHAAWVVEDETAGTVEAVDRMLADLLPAAIASARREAAGIQALIDTQARAAGVEPFRLAPWDWQYYAERVRAAACAFDDADVRPYFEIWNVLERGVFFAAERLYGLSFRQRDDLPRYHPDIRVYDVVDRDGSALGLFIADYYARDSKQGGAWMNAYVSQSRLHGTRPVIANQLNVPKPGADEPTLLSFEEVTAMFHEFGHALHGLLSNVRYRSLAGTAVPRDFVEFPSQYNEMWARDATVLAHFARHHQTGAPLPRTLLARVLAATRFNQGQKITEYLASAVLDQRWHQLSAGRTPAANEVEHFEQQALAEAGLDLPAIAPRYRSTYFSHVFSGGYSAGYYAYLWSEVLARDTERWMQRHGGLDRANGDFLRAKILSRGRSGDVSAMFRSFHGGPSDIGPLLEHRGLQPATPAGP